MFYIFSKIIVILPFSQAKYFFDINKTVKIKPSVFINESHTAFQNFIIFLKHQTTLAESKYYTPTSKEFSNLENLAQSRAARQSHFQTATQRINRLYIRIFIARERVISPVKTFARVLCSKQTEGNKGKKTENNRFQFS